MNNDQNNQPMGQPNVPTPNMDPMNNAGAPIPPMGMENPAPVPPVGVDAPAPGQPETSDVPSMLEQGAPIPPVGGDVQPPMGVNPMDAQQMAPVPPVPPEQEMQAPVPPMNPNPGMTPPPMGQPIPPVPPVQPGVAVQPVQDGSNNKNNKTLIIIIAAVVVLAVVALVGAIFISKGNTEKDSGSGNKGNNVNVYEEPGDDENEKKGAGDDSKTTTTTTAVTTSPISTTTTVAGSSSTETVDLMGFRFNKLSGYEYTASGDSLTVNDDNFMIYIGVIEGTFNEVKTAISELEQSLTADGTTVLSSQVTTVSGKEMLVMNCVFQGVTMIYYVAPSSNSNYLFAGTMANRMGTDPTADLSKAVSILNSSSYVGGYSGYSKSVKFNKNLKF